MNTKEFFNESRLSLIRSKIRLLEEILTIKGKCLKLRNEVTLVTRKKEATEKRFKKVSDLCGVVCSDCWVILPLLGGSFDHFGEVRTSLKPGHCIHCRISLKSKEEKLIFDTLLPNDHILQYARESCETAARILSIHEECINLTKSGSTFELPLGNEMDHPFPLPILSNKKDYLDGLLFQMKRFDEKLECLKKTLLYWVSYGEQHQNMVVIVDKLLHKMDKYHVLPKDEISSSPNHDASLCSVCFDSPKQVVFQCGHQSCFLCSEAMTSCHFCRSRVLLRIKLFD